MPSIVFNDLQSSETDSWVYLEGGDEKIKGEREVKRENLLE